MDGGKTVYTVKQINTYIKRMFEGDFVLRNIYIKGEISNCKYHGSGHIFFSLKDESGVIGCVMFASCAARLGFKLCDGLGVVAAGRVGVYEKSGSYRLIAESIWLDGVGDLHAKFEKLKAELGEKGMFSDIYKKPIPGFGFKIGVVTSETGAVIRDIYNVSTRRNPYCRIFLYPAKVQGEGAARTICEGIRCLDRMGLDCIIVGRGGGSIEDLWAFNEECVANAIFACETPVISAVGHETDFTIADFVADKRASTPSAAAEMAVFEYDRFLMDLEGYEEAFRRAARSALRRAKERAENLRLRLDKFSPVGILAEYRRHARDCERALERAMDEALSARRTRLGVLAERLSGMSPLKRISEGYAFVSGEGGRAIRSVDDAPVGGKVDIAVSDGRISARVCGTKKEELI